MIEGQVTVAPEDASGSTGSYEGELEAKGFEQEVSGTFR